MIERGLTPSMVKFNTFITIFSKKGNLEKAKWLFEWMEKRGVRPNHVTYNTLIDGYRKKGDLEESTFAT